MSAIAQPKGEGASESEGADLNSYDLPLTESLPHLLRRSHFYAESVFSNLLGHYGVTSRQLALMVAIWQKPGASQKMAGDIVALDVNTVSDTLRRMERKGLIARVASVRDARSISLQLTPTGLMLMKEVSKEVDRYNAQLAERLTDDETHELKRLLRKALDV